SFNLSLGQSLALLCREKRPIVSRTGSDGHGGTPTDAESLGRARTVGSKLEMVAAPEERAHFARGNVRVRRHHLGDRMTAHHDLERPAGDSLERATVDVRDQVAESIDAKHLTTD